MKKLCFIVYNFNHSGGMEKVNSILVNELATHQEYDITLLSLFGDIGNEFFKLSDKSNINIKYLLKNCNFYTNIPIFMPFEALFLLILSKITKKQLKI